MARPKKPVQPQATTYRLGIAEASLHRLLQKCYDQLLEPFGITKMQWLIIGSIFDAGSRGMRVSDLADELDTTLTYLTNTVNVLESKNILLRSRNDKDSRSKLVTVHPNFMPRCQEIERRLQAGLQEAIYSKVKPKDFATHTKVLFDIRELDIKIPRK